MLGDARLRGHDELKLSNLHLQNSVFASGDVVALAETMQLHLGLPGGHVIRGSDEVSVHVEEHNVS